MSEEHGKIVILNGAPRSGKSTLAHALQAQMPDVWINLGVDAAIKTLPEQYRPGIGLRPGGERQDLEPLIQAQYQALFNSMAAYAQTGLNVVADLDIHDSYSQPLGIWPMMLDLVSQFSLLLVKVQASPALIQARRLATWGQTIDSEMLSQWETAVHTGHQYDLVLKSDAQAPIANVDRLIKKITAMGD